MSIGNNIKTKRSELGLSQEILAEKLHISQATLSNIEANKSTPDVILLQQIADILDTNINELLDGNTIIINNTNQKGGIGYAEVVNKFSDKLIALHVKQLAEKDDLIKELISKLSKS
ncbi:MAG: helix-turn-helix transcriptional regulator [Winogradskyella sp.]|uniref:helix-turn-helix domain-containing protein n=1 Tax=Winogradskyella sp. TaxID=1883156 RepID=UPI0018443FAC|nr:helix-turn-helix transcriptional regulator [Winogradskyella sp.]MBT8244837.1 helix-turn-helix domain-containing protein [Winogradskyella sp.]NNK23839.1 helix-turn-helix transcriptional regulator [Winogradskyella sp.]